MPYTPADAKCPVCGQATGVYTVEREKRTPDTPIKCMACGMEAPAHEWFQDRKRS